jgi:hypothetical protein
MGSNSQNSVQPVSAEPSMDVSVCRSDPHLTCQPLPGQVGVVTPAIFFEFGGG